MINNGLQGRGELEVHILTSIEYFPEAVFVVVKVAVGLNKYMVYFR